MPQGKPNCATPAVTWAPDGSRVYAAYSYLIGDASHPQEAGAVVSSSTNEGLNWSSPKIALRYRYGSDKIMSLRLSTPLRTSDAKWVYLLSELNHFGSGHTDFKRSADGGRTWSPSQFILGYVSRWGGATRPSLAGGLGGDVLVAWGQWGWDNDYNLDFSKIMVRHSADYGNAFSAAVGAVSDTWQDAAVAFGSGGTAHLVYLDGLPGKPSYVYSTKAPYTAWSTPVVLSDDISAAYSSPALSVSACGSNTSVLHAIWMDDRLGAYHFFYTRKVAKTGETWSPNLRISGTALPQSYWWSTAIAAGVGSAVSVWSQQDLDGSFPVQTSRIAPGVSCP